jgi:hypothetical protein
MNDTLVQPVPQRRDLVTASQGSQNIGFTGAADFALTLRVADCLSKSELVPDSYRGEKGFSNCVVALELSARLGISWMAVMQNLYVVYGRPAWMSSFLIANVNGCGRFHSLRFDLEGQGESRACTAWTCEKSVKIPANVRTLAQAKAADLPVLEGATITWKMVVAEGWHSKKGSKWVTMPDQMFRYRAASFWSRVYAPELTMGIRTVEEMDDAPLTVASEDRTQAVRDKLIANAATVTSVLAEPHADEAPGSEEKGSGHASPDEPPSRSDPGFVRLMLIDLFSKADSSAAATAAVEQADKFTKFGPKWRAGLNPQIEAMWKRVEGSGE